MSAGDVVVDEHSSSDPFPYLQIHRTVEAVAANMAAAFKMTIDRAGWGLIVFWRRCADPREIEALYDAGKRTVVLDAATLRRRLTIAFGEDLDHDLLAEVGIVAKEGDGFRVRGCSRYFGILEARRKNRASGSKGGRVSAARRKSSAAQAVAPKETKSASAAQAVVQETTKSPSAAQATAQQETRGERREVRGKTSLRTPSEQEETWDCLERARAEHCQQMGIEPGEDKRPPPSEINARLNAAVEGFFARVADGTHISPFDDLCVLHLRYLDSDFGRFDKDKNPRTPPWPTGLFLSPKVLERFREADAKEQAA